MAGDDLRHPNELIASLRAAHAGISERAGVLRKAEDCERRAALATDERIRLAGSAEPTIGSPAPGLGFSGNDDAMIAGTAALPLAMPDPGRTHTA